jgi:competence protein ComFC
LMEKLKYDGQKEIGVHLGQLAQKALLSKIPDDSIFVPVPLHPKKVRLRGFNQAEIIADGISGEKHRVLSDYLIRKRETPTQTRLNRDERIKNVSGAFEINKRRNDGNSKDKKIIIVDDVMTSGATINEAALTLKKSGVKEVFALGVASPVVSDFY